MNAFNKQAPAAKDEIFQGDLKTYLDQFFEDTIPPEAMKIDSWNELRNYLSSLVVSTMPETVGGLDHRVYGFEKDHLPTMLLKKIFY